MEDPAALSRGVGLNANDIAAPSRVGRCVRYPGQVNGLRCWFACVGSGLLVRQHDATRVACMRSRNKALAGVPAQLVENAAGLVATLGYRDAKLAQGDARRST